MSFSAHAQLEFTALLTKTNIIARVFLLDAFGLQARQSAQIPVPTLAADHDPS